MKTNIPLKFLVFVNLYLLTNSLQNKFHESLNQEELGQLFNVRSHNEVPEYKVVRIHSRSKRNADEKEHIRTVQINAFGEHRTLHLKPNLELSRNVPVYFADTHEKGKGVKLTPLPTDRDTGTPYQDESSKAAVMVHQDPNTGQISFEGTIGDDLVLRPLPLSLHTLVPPNDSQGRGREDEASENVLLEDEELFTDQKEDEDLIFSDGLPLVPDDEFVTGESILSKVESKSKNETKEQLPEGLLLLRKKRSASSEESSGSLHVIYKRKLPLVETDYAMLELDKIPLHTPETRSKRRKRDAPFVIYPEILVLVDYDGYLLHGQDNSKIKSYYVSFWNGVDLRYKLLSNPKVKISIAGIIISRSRDAMPYLERNRVGRDAIDSASALTDMGKYLYQERRLPTYDIAVAITKYDLCRRRKSGNCTTGTAGFAYVGGACVVNKRLQKVNSVAIVEDTGGFSGIIVAAHEVGHLLGAVHDGSPPPSYLGGPGARHCKWKDGFIMSDLRHTDRGFRWSTCSIEQFHHFLNGETATCLYNLPHEDESLPRVLPGKLLTLDAQCRKDRGTTACFKDERVCAQLFCFDSSSGFCVSYRPAAEGSDCGNGKICLNGKCVYDDENSISDLDIHRPEDNYLYDSSLYSADTLSTSTTKTTTTTTTPQPQYSTSRRSGWLKNNKIWKNDENRNTPKPFNNNDNQHNTQSPWSPIIHTTTTTTTTTTPYTTRYIPTQRTTREVDIPQYYNREQEEKQPYNSIKENDSKNACVDLLPNESSSLSCPDFLSKYGARYCNHRYIHKNCCQSQQQLC